MIASKASFLNRLYAIHKPFRPVEVGENIDGSTPPTVFIGRYGYPKVFIGPLVPPIHGDTRMFDAPEQWLSTYNNSGTIAQMRMQLVRGMEIVDVKDQGKISESVREIALSKNPIDTEMEFSRKPRGGNFHEEIQPFGPSAPIKSLSVDSGSFDPNLEKAYYDTDLKSKDAIIDLHERNVPFSSIQKALSVGAFGIKKNRKMVPTRWSITAVDSTLSEHLLESLRGYPTIESYRVYEHSSLSNSYVIIMLPSHWSYEWIEAFFPHIIGEKLEIFYDYERFEKKKEYSCTGGCYYSARLGVAERLRKEGKQAAVVILRESYEDYIPLGVWNVRENVRAAMAREHKEFSTFEEVIAYIKGRLRLPMSTWLANSELLKKIYQNKGRLPSTRGYVQQCL